MNEQTVTDYDWSPKQISFKELTKFGSSYSEIEGVPAKKVVLEGSKTADPNFQTRYSHVRSYIFWGSAGQSNEWGNYVIAITDEQDEKVDDLLTNISSLPSLRREADTTQNIWRGFFPLQYKKKVLFTQKIHIKTQDLPRWKPMVHLERRTLEFGNE